MKTISWALAALVIAGCTAQEELVVSANRLASTAVDDPERRWSDATIPYYVDADGSLGATYCGTSSDGDQPAGEAFTLDDLWRIHLAIWRWDDFTPLTFEPVALDVDGPPTLIITRSTPGAHTIAAKDGQDPAWFCVLLPTGLDATTAAHELGHAIGMIHEHKRPDRDDFVTVDTSCTRPGDLPAYEKEDEADVVELGPYDYDSVMHYTGAGSCCTPGESLSDRLTHEVIWTCPSTCWNALHACAVVPLTKKDGTLIPRYTDISKGDVNTVFRMYEQPLGNDEPGDRMGAQMVSGDFDADGYLDLAVGAPDEITKVDGVDTRTGAVFLFKGTAARLVAWKVLRSKRRTEGGKFGAALAAGDLDGDGRTDLAVGAPGERSRSSATVRGGNVYVFQAVRTPRLDWDADAFRYFGIDHWAFYDAADAGAPVGEGAELGAALSIVDLDGDGRKDLIIGAPGGALGTVASGYVAILAGRADDDDGIDDHPLAWARLSQGAGGARFGQSLASFAKNGGRWLVVGAPENGISGGSGAAYTFSPQAPGMLLVEELRPAAAGAHFGSAMAAGRFGATQSRGFVAIGAPDADSGRGTITVYTVAGLSLTASQTLGQPWMGQADHLGGVLTVVDVLGGVDTLVAGLPSHDKGLLVDAGAVRSFVATSSTTTPLPATGALLENPHSNAAAGDHFGSSVARFGVYDFDTGALTSHTTVYGGDGFVDGGAITFKDPVTTRWRIFDQTYADPQ